VAAVPGVILLKTDSSLKPMVSPDSTVNLETQRYQEQFGRDPITVILSGNPEDISLGENLAQINAFEQEFTEKYNCDIISPVTIINAAIHQADQAQLQMIDQISQAVQDAVQAAVQQAKEAGLDEAAQEQAAEKAQDQVVQQFQVEIEQIKQVGIPSLDNGNFIDAVVYGQDGSINPSLASLMPDPEHALVIITPAGTMSASDVLKLSHDVQEYFKANHLHGVTATTAGFTLVTEAISSNMKRNLMILLGLAVVVMVVVLFSLFRVRMRLLSLLMVGIGALWTFGLMGYISIPITMATMAVLPVLIGLGIDYPIQFHNRYQEEVSRNGSVAKAISTSFLKMAPAVGIALLATAIGFATLYVSSVPMIRDFGIILLIGVVLCYLVALFLLYSSVFLADRKVPIAKLGKASRMAGNRMERILAKIGAYAIKYPLSICIIAVVLGTAGGVVDHWLPVNTDFTRLIPQNMTALQNTQNLNSLLGIGGQIQFMVEADNVTSQSVLTRLKTFEENEVTLYPELIDANSPATLISSATGGVIPPQEQIDQILDGTPVAIIRQSISTDQRMATLSFGIKTITLEETHDLISNIAQDSQRLDGITITPVGTLAMSTAMIDSVIKSRILMDGLCLVAILVVLILMYRRFTRAFFIIVCTGIVIGWSSLTMFIFGIPLNPLTAVLGVITTAIGTEFMVLLTSRYEEEKKGGAAPRQAMIMAVTKMGRAVVTTGITTLGGFGVLLASNFVLIRDFGIATVIGIFLCLVSTIVVMPPLMVWWDERMASRLARQE
jgi:hydrophobe/amphiphile efflux-3 (HAE3) family protein